MKFNRFLNFGDNQFDNFRGFVIFKGENFIFGLRGLFDLETFLPAFEITHSKLIYNKVFGVKRGFRFKMKS